ncbi:MAG: sigma-70 family RNA polymerase sigma factor [Acidobacteriaceae bacterium]|nr:sigma-70 family RNA polymerase sigma factor [Acidobacteriaceae bacterium]MBV9033075.1 sigma-70 family RNA polymerase sigma factor [Acidobacteriaceae bacterium]MBV9305528.1 sigma-70 family RNA polymerase sigma factor [Acidobacteriaceae bacterium]
MTENPQNVTVLLAKWGQGDREALNALTPLVYNELRKLAKSYLRRERVGHTLEGTALVHEAYLRLIDQREVEWRNRNHFFALAAELIRRILVDHARARIATKRGGSHVKLSLDEAITPTDEKDLDLLALNDALDALARTDAQQSRVVELRYFAGLTIEETADVLQISTATVKRDWVMAKAFLKREMLRHVGV